MTTLSRDVFGITVLKNNHPDIRRIKREVGATVIHGNKFWHASHLLIDYLRTYPPERHWRILEVGCGWGINGIYCAKHYAAKLTALDADNAVFACLDHHAELNGVKITTLKSRFEAVTVAKFSEFDMVIGSDICFWSEMTKPLYNMINRAHRAGVKRIVMTDPGRGPFREMAEKCCKKYRAVYDNWSVPHPYNTSGLVLDIG